MRNLFIVGGSIASKEYIRHDSLAVDCYFKATNFTQWPDGNYAILALPQLLLGTALDCRQIFVPI
jgi:hypothetical protein